MPSSSHEYIVEISDIPSIQVMIDRPKASALTAQFVRDRRSKIRLSQNELADILGVSQSEISQIEAGSISDISDDLLMQIVQVTSREAGANPLGTKMLAQLPRHDDRVATAKSSTTPTSQRVFIVHGHDDAAREAAARLVERAGLTAVILREQPNRGLTIIEKFENHSERADFAVVLLTPDDVGGPRGTPPDQLRNRARQNVVAELFFFIGKLGRNKVCILVKGSIEIPSDFAGIVYEPMDEAGRWELKLATEMKAAGLPIDLNRIFGR